MKKIMILQAAAFTLSLGAVAQATYAFPQLKVAPGQTITVLTLDNSSGNQGTFVYPSTKGSVAAMPDTLIAPDGTTKILPARFSSKQLTVQGEWNFSARTDSFVTDRKGLKYIKLKQP